MLGNTVSDVNRGDDPWDSTRRAVSFWYKGEFLNCRALLTSSLGERYIDYKFTTGTHSVDGSGNVTFYLGSMPTTEWTRFERNVEADFEAVSSGTWTNTDGLYIRIPGTLGSEDTLLDEIRLSDSVTVDHNTLGPGVIGHFLRNTTWDDTSSLAREDKWFHYDQTGAVLSVSDLSGEASLNYNQDAFGNALADWSGALWDNSTTSGRRWGHMRYDAELLLWLGSELDPQTGTPPGGGGISISDDDVPYNLEELTNCSNCLGSGDLIRKSLMHAKKEIRGGGIAQGPLLDCMERQLDGDGALQFSCGDCSSDQELRGMLGLGPDIPLGSYEDALGITPGLYTGGRDGTSDDPASKVVLCSNRFAGHEGLGKTILHEVAHSCGWRHDGFPSSTEVPPGTPSLAGKNVQGPSRYGVPGPFGAATW